MKSCPTGCPLASNIVQSLSRSLRTAERRAQTVTFLNPPTRIHPLHCRQNHPIRVGPAVRRVKGLPGIQRQSDPVTVAASGEKPYIRVLTARYRVTLLTDAATTAVPHLNHHSKNIPITVPSWTCSIPALEPPRLDIFISAARRPILSRHRHQRLPPCPNLPEGAFSRCVQVRLSVARSPKTASLMTEGSEAGIRSERVSERLATTIASALASFRLVNTFSHPLQRLPSKSSALVLALFLSSVVALPSYASCPQRPFLAVCPRVTATFEDPVS